MQKKVLFFVTANMGFQMVSNKKNVILTLQSIILGSLGIVIGDGRNKTFL